MRASRRKRLPEFGISYDEYLVLVDKHGGRCAICGTDKPTRGGKQQRWAIDHCHVSGRIRGILCKTCNTGIGMLGDNADGLRRALAYLAEFEGESCPC